MPRRQEETETAVEKRLDEVREQEGLAPEVVSAQEAAVREAYDEETVVGRSRRASVSNDGTVYEYHELLEAGYSYEVDDVKSTPEEVAGALKLAGLTKASRDEVNAAVRAFRSHPVTD